jgi:CO dehydrogenase nickel-insertion accessory protein CooC1
MIMHLDLTPEALLTQLGYPKSEQTLKQMNDIIANTEGFEHFARHIPSFNDALAVEKGYIAMSNSVPHLKIKCDADTTADNLSAFEVLVNRWAEKYKLELKAANENTYYIIGQK